MLDVLARPSKQNTWMLLQLGQRQSEAILIDILPESSVCLLLQARNLALFPQQLAAL